jgi:putative membrane protein
MKEIYRIAVLTCATVTPLLWSLPSRADTAEQDQQFLAMAAQADVNEIKLSQLAESKATAPNVKAFAHKMIVDHKKLEVKMRPYAMAWKVTPPVDLDSDHKDEYAKLNGLSGADFDKEYINAMAEDHGKALDAFSKEVDTTDNPKFKTAVTEGKAVVAAHKNMADDLKGKM